MSGGKKQKNRKSDNRFLSLNKNGWITIFLMFGAVLALGLIIYTYIPHQTVDKNIVLTEPALANIGIQGYQAQNPPIVELEYPEKVFAGDVDKIKASLSTNGINFEESQRMVAVFFLELDGAKFGPDGDILIPMKEPHAADADWDFSAIRPGRMDGKIWIHLQYQDADGNTQNHLLLSYPIEVQSIAFGGVSIVVVRLGSVFIFFTLIIYLVIKSIKDRYQRQNP